MQDEVIKIELNEGEYVDRRRFDGCEATIVDSRFVELPVNFRDNPDMKTYVFHQVVYEKDDGERTAVNYSLGSPNNYLPNPSGKTIGRGRSGKNVQFPISSNCAAFLAALKRLGAPMNQLFLNSDVSAIIGIKVRLKLLRRTDAADGKSPQQLWPVAFVGVEEKKKEGSKGKTENQVELTELAEKLVCQILSEHDGKIAKKDLVLEISKHQIGGGYTANDVIKLVFSGDFLSSKDRPWTFNEDDSIVEQIPF